MVKNVAAETFKQVTAHRVMCHWENGGAGQKQAIEGGNKEGNPSDNFRCLREHHELKPKFHYAWGSLGEVGIMEFGPKGTWRICCGLVANVMGKSV